MNTDKTKFFIDGIESVSVVDGIVRIALFNYQTAATEHSGKMPPHEISCELLTSMPGLLRLQEIINKSVTDLIAREQQRNAEQKPVQSENFPIGAEN